MYATIDLEKIGANLKRLIKESKYRTQENFAYDNFYDPRTVRRWGQKGIDNIATLNEIAKALEVDVTALLF